MSFNNFRFAAGLLSLLLDSCIGLSQDLVPANPLVSKEDAKNVESSRPLGDSLFDLVIDSDNNNGLELPDASEWEEQIETHEFSIGKLVETGAKRFTPVLIRLNKKVFQQPIGDIRVKLEIENAKGAVRLWSKPQVANQDDKQGLLQPGDSYPLDELNFDVSTGIATFWIEAVTAAPGIHTKSAIDRNGRPDMFLRANLQGVEQREQLTDAVKYLPVDPKSFFPTLIDPANRHIRNSIAAVLVNGPGGQSGTLRAFNPQQSKAYGFRLVPENEFADMLAASQFIRIQKRYLFDVLYYKLRETPELPVRRGVENFRAGLYRDYNSGDYTLAFQYSLKDNCTEVFMNLAPRFFWGRAEGSHHRVAALFLSGYFSDKKSDKKFGVNFPGLQLTGVGVGGELAVFGAIGSGLHADTFNRKPIPEGMVKLILTHYDPTTKKEIERSPGSLKRSKDLGNLTSNYILLDKHPYRYRVERGR